MPTETLAVRLRAAAADFAGWNNDEDAALLLEASSALDAAARRDEAFGLLLAYAECDAAYQRCAEWTDSLAAFRRHGYSGTDYESEAIGWLESLRCRALAAAREGQP